MTAPVQQLWLYRSYSVELTLVKNLLIEKKVYLVYFISTVMVVILRSDNVEFIRGFNVLDDIKEEDVFQKGSKTKSFTLLQEG
ncbi:MAG: hypothetical protein GWN64_16280 [Candidatus Thorarchaeota archaeon]|nr:hypothetical protein [Candidatus Thorarchaeota archaeon]